MHKSLKGCWFVSQYLRLTAFLRGFKKEAALEVLIGLLITACGFLQAYMVAKAVDSVFAKQMFSAVYSYLAAALAAILIRAFFIRLNEGYKKEMAAKVKGGIRETLLDKLMLLGPAYESKRRSGNVQSLITDGVESFEPFLVNYIPQTAVVLVSVSAVVVYICTMDVSVGLLILAAAVLSILVPHFFMPMVSKVMVEYWQSYAYLNAQYIEAMQGMDTLKAFHASKTAKEHLKTDADNFADESIRNTGVSLADSSLIIICSAIGTSVSVALAAWHMATGRLTSQELLIILFLAGECMRPLSDLNMFWHSSYLGFSVADQLYAVLDEPVVLSEPAYPGPVSADSPELRLNDATFRYDKNEPPALLNASIVFRSGETTAIVGRSGSGKSTIVNLLLRFFDPQQGSVSLGGKDIRAYPLAELRSQIAVVFQDTYLFYGSVADNLRMAKPGASREELIAAAKAANAHDFIEKLPDGYDTMIGERGTTLSGGEKQRLAIARAVLKDAPVLILDEATSSVDVESEALIQKAMDEVSRGRTTIVIAHRLSTIRNADNIYVMENGRVSEQGAHPALLRKDGEYARLVCTQESAGMIG